MPSVTNASLPLTRLPPQPKGDSERCAHGARMLRCKTLKASVLVAALAVIALSGGCGTRPSVAEVASTHDKKPEAENHSGQARQLRVQPAAFQQSSVRSIELLGSVEGYEMVMLYAKVGGYLTEVRADIGDRVQQGDELAKLYVPEMLQEVKRKAALVLSAQANAKQAHAAIRLAEAAVESANAVLEETQTLRVAKQAELAYQQKRLDRISQLAQKRTVTGELLDEATFQVSAARAGLGTADARIRTAQASLVAANANVDKAETDHESALALVEVARADHARVEELLQYATITAPFSGVNTQRFVHRGDFVQPAEGNSAARPLFVLTRIDRVRIVVHVPMSDVGYLDRGDSAVFDRIEPLPGQSFEGRVSRIALALDEESRTMRAEIEMQNPANATGVRQILPGYFGYVTLFLDD